MFVLGTPKGRRITAMAALLMGLLTPVAAAAEPANPSERPGESTSEGLVQSPSSGVGPVASHVEDNRTERTLEILTAQGTWIGKVEPSRGTSAEVASPAQLRAATAAKPHRQRVRTRTRAASTRPLNFYDIRRTMWFN